MGHDAIRDPAREILREITRGGLAGLLTGVVVAGLGGRVVMRLAAIMVPASTGAVTENGNVIGEITVEGTLLLVVFGGLFFGAVGGAVWVTIRPWLPDSVGARALLAVPIALALGTVSIVDADNVDFAILGRDPLVVALLLVLVALFGPGLVVAESVLERWLPHAGSGDRVAITVYGLVTFLGLVVTLFLVVPVILGSELTLAGIALIGVGAATLVAWSLRVTRSARPGRRLTIAARTMIAAATIAGLWVAWGDVLGTLRLGVG